MIPAFPRILPDRDKWRNWYLDEDTTVLLFNGDTIHIPKGYRFDAHSVPFFLRWIFPRNQGRDIYAALVHDYLIDTSPFHRYDRAFIDYEYTRFMLNPLYQITELRSRLMSAAVRLYGYLTRTIWNDNRGDFTKYRTTVRVFVEEDAV